ncbi:MAG: MBL fold metallo-hydrolase [Oscillospiraceae bacterium]|nr:MBL fold metallo-hydrolase [Oscillospiraceae bacterium]
MNVIRLILGAFQTNTYIVYSGKDAVVIDPAASSDKISFKLLEKGCTLKKILLTHGHYDHTAAARDLRSATGAEIYIHEGDAPMLSDPEKSFATFINESYKLFDTKNFIKEGDVIEVGDMKFTVMHTPGHSAGSVMFICGDTIFSGDTLFENSVGRTDGWSGDSQEQARSLARIKKMEGDFKILPGHESETTLKREQTSNLFLIHGII